MSRRKPPDRTPPPLPDDFAEMLLDGLESFPLSDERREAMRHRLMARIAASKAGIVTLRAGEGRWSEICPGVEGRTLHEDAHGRTWLARLAPGGRVPPHAHEGDEEILILEGSCTLDGEVMNPGDFERSPHGSHHPEMYSAAGCLLLVRTASPPAARPGP